MENFYLKCNYIYMLAARLIELKMDHDYTRIRRGHMIEQGQIVHMLQLFFYMYSISPPIYVYIYIYIHIYTYIYIFIPL